MEKLFETLLGMSGTASLVILAVLLARLALRRAPKVFSYALWAVVLLRLLCPFSLESAFSLLPAAQVVPVAGRGGTEAQVIRVETGLPAVDQPVNDFFVQHPYQGLPARPQDTETTPAPVIPQTGDAPDWRTVPAVIWLAGMAGLLGWSALSLLRLRRTLAEAIPLEGEAKVWLADRIPSPFVLGLLRPRIYLPSNLPVGERDYILLHERTHIRRGDHLFRALAWLAVALHWFNPLVWLAFRLAGKDMEMSCDEAVLRKMDRDVRADYSSSLLRLSAGGKLPAGPLAFGDSDPKSRIKNILSYKKPALWVLVAAVIAVAATCAALATNQPTLIDASTITSFTVFDASSSSHSHSGSVVYTSADRAKDLFNPTDPRTLSQEDGEELVRLINSYSKRVWDRGEFQLNGPEHHFVRMDCADGSFYLLDYWYWNGFSFNPFHGGEDDYTTLVTCFNKWGEMGTTWQMNYHFDSAFREWQNGIQQRYSNVEVWVDYWNSPEDLTWDEHKDIQLPEFPGVTFRWTPGTVSALEPEAELYSGMPVYNVFLCDLNGDGNREFCSTVCWGSGMIDSHIVVYDYANRREYTLWDRGEYDYALSLEDGQLMVTMSKYPDLEEVLSTGRLILTEDGRLAIEDQPVDNTAALPLDPHFELGKNEGTVLATGLGDVYVEWDRYSSVQPFLYFAGDPAFFCYRLAGKWVEGSTQWADDKSGDRSVIEVRFVLSGEPPEGGTIDGFSFDFTVDTESGTITKQDFKSWVEGETMELKNSEMVTAARTLARLLRETEAYYYTQTAPEIDLSAARYALDDLWVQVDITGLDCDHARWYARELNTSSEIPENALGYLEISQPDFLGFSDCYYATAVYSPQSDPDLIWLELSPRVRGTIHEVEYTVNLTSGYYTCIKGTPSPLIEEESLLSAARAMRQLILEASDFYAASAVPEEGPLPFDKPMKLWFGSGAGGWSTILALHPDGRFEGDYTDADMDTLYVCQFHGTFKDITQVTDASWSMTLDTLELDTKYPVGREWDEDGYHYISSYPYGFDDGDYSALKPGAEFTFYTPDATGYAPGDELYGMTDDVDSPLYQFWTWWPRKHGWGPYGDTLDCYALHNITSGRGFFGLNAWGLL